MKKEDELRNQLKAVRLRLGMSQQELATAAGIARQTIGGIEAGTYALSLTVALRLSKVLGCPVEELFWLESELPTVEAVMVGDSELPVGPEPVRVGMARVGGHWIASSLEGENAFRSEMIPADGAGVWDAVKGVLRVRLLDTAETLARTVRLAGCAPVLSLWARSAERWHPGLRVQWAYANSRAALAALVQDEVHLAGVHLFDMQTGEDNAYFAQEAMRAIPTALVNLGAWEEGFVVARGNPKGLRSGGDLARSGIILVNREPGAGSRLLLDSLLKKEGVSSDAIVGYDNIAAGHREIAHAVATGRADVGVSTAGIAALYNLSFVSLHTVRYDLVLRQASLQEEFVQQLLGTLHHRWVRAQFATLGGYDTTQTGEVTLLGPGAK